MITRFAQLALAAGMLLAPMSGSRAQQPSDEPSYLFYVASESTDEVTLLRFTPGSGLSIERVIPVGFWPVEMEGPHGVSIDPEGTHWYLTLGHGFPVFGSLLKFRTGVDTLEGIVTLGLFPATLAVTPGGLAFTVNSNFYGEHEPSTLSVVDVVTMMEVERIQTCTMPHGSRLSPDGARHYSACMIDDQLVEVDVYGLTVARSLDVSMSESTADSGRHHGDAVVQQCSPTWVAPAPDGKHVYVTCNKSSEIVEVDLEDWKITRRWDAPGAPYNAQVTPDGTLLVVTQKGSAEVSVWELPSGKRRALIQSTRTVTHGVAISPDGRYAFISVEGVRGEPGAVDVIDLQTLEKVATVDIGKQAGGIAFWRTT